MPYEAEDEGGRRVSSATGHFGGDGLSIVICAARLTWQLLFRPCKGLVFFEKRPPCLSFALLVGVFLSGYLDSLGAKLE